MQQGAAVGTATPGRLWSRLPPRTIRARLAFFYFGAFTLSGALLLATTVGYWQSTTSAQASAVPAGAVGSVSTGPGLVRTPQVNQHISDSHQLLVAAGAALALMVGLSIVFGWVAAGRILRPLRTITTATRRISATNLHERLRLAGPDDELKELGDTFDELLGRLEKSFRLERQFVANASHELRTPLATMRASLDVAMAKPGPPSPPMATLSERLRRELDHVDELLESFLTLAQAQRGEIADEALVSLDGAASIAIERHWGAIAGSQLQVEQERCPVAWARGSQTLLERLVENLVDNAVKHNVQGGWLSVRTAVYGEASCLIVRRPRRPRQRSQPGRRRLPGQALSFPRAGPAGPGLGPPAACRPGTRL
jgi:signal transduction histidine kinase